MKTVFFVLCVTLLASSTLGLRLGKTNDLQQTLRVNKALSTDNQTLDDGQKMKYEGDFDAQMKQFVADVEAAKTLASTADGEGARDVDAQMKQLIAEPTLLEAASTAAIVPDGFWCTEDYWIDGDCPSGRPSNFDVETLEEALAIFAEHPGATNFQFHEEAFEKWDNGNLFIGEVVRGTHKSTFPGLACVKKTPGQDEDPCDSVDCGPHGHCGIGVCTCSGGYSGKHCSIKPEFWCTEVQQGDITVQYRPWIRNIHAQKSAQTL